MCDTFCPVPFILSARDALHFRVRLKQKNVYIAEEMRNCLEFYSELLLTNYSDKLIAGQVQAEMLQKKHECTKEFHLHCLENRFEIV